jgi:radical SAM superfamily enzyme with C-terminal helix-hairpin-helix motif
MRLALLALPLLLVACQSEPPAPDVPADPIENIPALAEPTAPINLNTATSEEFATIPGVGDRMVHEFEEYRPYASVREFRQEIGKYVDEDQVAAYEEYVFVPVDPNESDAETLQQLPGVGADEASMLIEGRPYADDEAFMARFSEVAPGADVGAMRPYLAR